MHRPLQPIVPNRLPASSLKHLPLATKFRRSEQFKRHTSRLPKTFFRFGPPGMTLSVTLVKASAEEREGTEDMEDGLDELDFALDGEIPDFDDLVLDDAFYKKIGIDKEILDKHPPWSPEYTDPQGYNLSFEDYLQNRSDIPDYIKSDLKDAQYFGPPVLLTAGFRLEEMPLLRLTVDNLIGKHVKVIPVFGQEVLEMEVEAALNLPEPEWERPRPEEWTRGGTWGSQRIIVFGGLPMESQAAIVEVIEESGLPPVCVTIASEQTRHFQLGRLMADAIKLQRDRKNPDKQLWEGDRMIKDVSDLQGFVKNKMTERIRTIKDGLEKGEAELEEDKKTGTMRVKMEGLEETIFDAEEISMPMTSSAETKARPKFKRRNLEMPSTVSEDRTSRGEAIGIDLEDVGRGRPMTSEEAEIHVLTDQLDDPLSDFFAVDDLVSDAMGIRKPDRPSRLPTNPVFEPKAPENDSGRIYPISSEPETIEDNVKRNTVFTGLVKDPTKFMKDNFGYDASKEKSISIDGDGIETIDVTSVEQQESLEGRFDNIGRSRGDRGNSVGDVIDEAVASGVDPEKLREYIRSMSNRSKFRKRFRRKE